MSRSDVAAPSRCAILPPYLLERLADADDPVVRDAALASLAVDATMRRVRDERAARTDASTQQGQQGHGLVPPHLRGRASAEHRTVATTEQPGQDHTQTVSRTVYDAKHRTSLPGAVKRAEGAKATRDRAVDQAYDGLGATWELFHSAYGRDSLDGRGLPLLASVHYGQRYDNAFWDGQQMVFGDGDGVLFNGFTGSVDVIGHELTHGFTQYTAGLVYLAQSGALNESVSDVFGSLVRQRVLAQDAADADWLIGAGLFTPVVHGVALRSMKAPGTAYDDPQLGRDPQPAHMGDYVDEPHDADHDNGGVHRNSGIPNHAFYLAAVAIGGAAWEKAGQVWFDTMTNGSLAKDADFVTFARATVAAAEKRYGADHDVAQHVGTAWTQVGVLS